MTNYNFIDDHINNTQIVENTYIFPCWMKIYILLIGFMVACTAIILIYYLLFCIDFYSQNRDNINKFLNFISIMDDPQISDMITKLDNIINLLPSVFNCTISNTTHIISNQLLY